MIDSQLPCSGLKSADLHLLYYLSLRFQLSKRLMMFTAPSVLKTGLSVAPLIYCYLPSVPSFYSPASEGLHRNGVRLNLLNQHTATQLIVLSLIYNFTPSLNQLQSSTISPAPHISNRAMHRKETEMKRMRI